ncbi:MAG TPA: type II toxin-antitoxin system RelE/ParE family toxin [Longimicrobiaceae bacterium]|nr:type II toxin-antitoxin system RelE/ParE family toxin [Longimicrobiaceae bacterium]
MTYDVQVERQADADIEEAYAYYLEHAPGYADGWLDGLREALGSLRRMPQRCGLARENRFFKAEIRQLLYESYRVLFTIRERRVHVLHIRHQARDTLKPRRGRPDAGP